MFPAGGSSSATTRSISAAIGQLLACMGGCLGCCSRSTPVIVVDEPSKGLKIQGQTVKKSGFSEDFWSTSTYEMDGVQSQRSISSISTSTQAHDLNGVGSSSSSNPSEFVNHGLLLWNQTRQQWLGNKRPETSSQKVQEPRLRRWWISWWTSGTRRACMVSPSVTWVSDSRTYVTL